MGGQIPVAAGNQRAVTFKFTDECQDRSFRDDHASGCEIGAPTSKLDAPFFAQQKRDDVEKGLERKLTDDGHIWTV